MEITHLPAQRRKRLRTHYELRGSPELGYRWWLMHSFCDIPPVFIGTEDHLPSLAREFLNRMRADPTIGSRRQARYINADLAFFPGQEHNGIPHDQNVDWLRQYKRNVTYDKRYGRYSTGRAYLVALVAPGNEDYPLQIWESRASVDFTDGNHLDAEYILVWKQQEESTAITNIKQPRAKGDLTQDEKDIIRRARQIGRYYPPLTCQKKKSSTNTSSPSAS